MDYHKLLDRQIRKTFPEEFLANPSVIEFLKRVSNSYESFEREIKISEHTFAISEQEYKKITEHLKQENAIKNESILQIKEAIRALDENSLVSLTDSNNSLIDVIQFLKEHILKQKQLEKDLVHSKEIAEKAANAKSEFLSTMSHEIRTPMNAVIGFTHLLLQNAREDQMEYLKLLKFSGENLLVVINDILDYSKIEAGKIEFENIDFDLRTLIQNIKGGFQEKANEDDITLEVLLDNQIPEMVKGDSVRLTQILTNLISNAVKFTEHGKVTVSASVSCGICAQTTILFEVKDTGIGIAKNKQEHIFDSFSQASSETTRKYGGTGLGLSISKRLLELQGSKIKVESELGKGSRFYFELRFDVSELKTNDAQTINSTKKKSLLGAQILMVEDNQINAFLAKQFFKQWEIACDVAENGKIALEMVQQKPYHLVLMDLQMPEMDGWQATLEIRKLPEEKYQKLPIIALTASAMNDVREKAISSGMNDSVTKPFNPDLLYATIAKYIKIPEDNIHL
jgi:signal transduction histidine kinase/ActR/RegA family two-component response regulator